MKSQKITAYLAIILLVFQLLDSFYNSNISHKAKYQYEFIVDQSIKSIAELRFNTYQHISKKFQQYLFWSMFIMLLFILTINNKQIYLYIIILGIFIYSLVYKYTEHNDYNKKYEKLEQYSTKEKLTTQMTIENEHFYLSYKKTSIIDSIIIVFLIFYCLFPNEHEDLIQE